MNKIIKLILAIFLIILSIILAIGYASSYIGWYGYKKWEYRVGTANIEESKQRGVFVKELHYQIDSFPDIISNFKPYIEKGFHYGHRSSSETIQLENSKYPFQLSFNFQVTSKLGLLLTDRELSKFDSFSNTKGYLKSPHLKDTIYVKLIGENIHKGVIKIWQ